MEIITLDQLRDSINNGLPTGDQFEVSEEKIDDAFFELVFSIGANVSSWKSVTLISGPVVDEVAEIWLARLELEAPIKGPLSFRVSAEHLQSAGLFLGKLSSSGKRESTDYYLPEQPKVGTRLHLTWLSDY